MSTTLHETPTRPSPPPPRRRRVALLAAGAVLVAALGSGAAFALGDRSDPQSTTAAQPAANTSSAKPAAGQSCGCHVFGHLMRPARTHGSAHRSDPVARPSRSTA